MQSFARAVLVESTVADCTAPESTGGGVCAYDHANITLQGGSQIERCTAHLFPGSTCGGLAVHESSHAEMLQSSINNCSGAGVIRGRSTLQMMQSTILDCNADRRAGFWVAAASTLLATDCVRAPRLELARGTVLHTRSGALSHSPGGVSPRFATRHTDLRRLQGAFERWRIRVVF